MQTIVITGASGGIGIELAGCFLISGWRVIAVSRNINELEKIKNDNLIILKANINETKEIERIKKICSTFSDIQIVINNAGTLINKPFLNITEDELISTYRANFFAPFLLLQKLIPILNKTERAHIVNIGSMGGFQGSVKFTGLTAYSSSKFALAGLTELLAEEFKSENISFNCLAIGAAQTKMLEEAFPGYQAPVSAKEMAEFIFNFASKQAKTNKRKDNTRFSKYTITFNNIFKLEKDNTNAQENCIYGIRAVIEAIKAGKELDKILLQKGLSNDLFHQLKKEIAGKEIPYQFVPPEKIKRLSNANHQGVIAFLANITYYKTDELLQSVFEKGKMPFVLILDRITDVRNFGAIARSAECAGVDFIVIPSRGAAQINSDAIKTSAGALHRIPVCREDNLKTTIEYLKESGLKIFACHEKTENTIYSFDYDQPLAIVMGSEENGISGEYLKRCDEQIKIPMAGTISSLNVSVATGIILFEVLKRRLKG